ncbi:MAG: lipoate--protein ligase family protein [Verrucomicrobia bacterium]|nr:MAG: lipoate--protein ligase family protein [Verrucomicrobiota bacterium]
METRFFVLPSRTDSAAANMAADFMLLRRCPSGLGEFPRFRAYGWHRPCWSFGYSQKIAWVREQLPPEAEGADLVRRPTGGGLVDHRNDWTYALVIPREHPLESVRAIECYRAAHLALSDALNFCGQAAALNEHCDAPCPPDDTVPTARGAAARRAPPKAPTVCFTRPELYDVIDPQTGKKIAGAAQKRTKEGLLLQGSLWRPAATAITNWDDFHAAFIEGLARTLGASILEMGWPDFAPHEFEGLTEQYASDEWTQAR